MQLLVIGRVYNEHVVYSYTEQKNVNVVDEYVLKKIEQSYKIMSVSEYRIYQIHGKLTDELIAVFYDEDRARRYLETFKGEE
jgi:hypothetical protein